MAKKGFEPHVFEALHFLGGVLYYGIPQYRLPDEIVDHELDVLRSLGGKFHTNCLVGKTVTIDELREQGFKGIYVATGAGKPKFMNIPGENAIHILSANEFLFRVNVMDADQPDSETPLYVGKKVIVVGGGNTAMDSCRTAKRLGADVTVVYRRTFDEMPAGRDEIEQAQEEGVNFMNLHNPQRYIVGDDGKVKGAVLDVMKLGEPDDSGRRRPVKTGETITVECDEVLVAVGVDPNPLVPQSIEGLKEGWAHAIEVNEDGQSNISDIYAGGDIARGAATVVLAMGDGRRAANKMAEELLAK